MWAKIASLLALIIENLIVRFLRKKEEVDRKNEIVKEVGERAEEAAEKAVSDSTGEPFEKPKPGELAPIKGGKIVPTIKQAQDWFTHRRKRKRP